MASKSSKEDKDALDALEAEAKEFDKVCLRLHNDFATNAKTHIGCRD